MGRMHVLCHTLRERQVQLDGLVQLGVGEAGCFRKVAAGGTVQCVLMLSWAGGVDSLMCVQVMLKVPL